VTEAPARPAVRREVAPVYAAGFVTAFGAHAVAANLGRYALGHHGSLWELGLLLGIYDGAEVVLKPVFGALADRTGAKPVMIGGLALFAAASAAFVIGGDPHLLAAARLAQGTGAAAFSPAAAATVAALGGRKRTGRLFGGYGGAKGIGYLAGPIAGGALVAAGGYPALFATLAVIAIGTAAAVTVLVPHARPDPRTSEAPGLGRRLTTAAFLQPVLLLAAATAALSAGVGFLPVLAGQHHLGPIAAGALVSLLAATAAVLQPIAGRRIDDGRLPPAAATAALAGCAAGFLLALAGLPGLIAGAILIGAGVATATPAGFARLAVATPAGQLGRTMGAAEAGRELGDAGGPVLVGAFGLISLTAGLGGLAAALLACAALAALGNHASPTPPGPAPPERRPCTHAQGKTDPDDHTTDYRERPGAVGPAPRQPRPSRPW
jgi:MFS transporter, DHA1 family, tetracycline resistance protein